MTGHGNNVVQIPFQRRVGSTPVTRNRNNVFQPRTPFQRLSGGGKYSCDWSHF